jgi:hypothetical protein
MGKRLHEKPLQFYKELKTAAALMTEQRNDEKLARDKIGHQ